MHDARPRAGVTAPSLAFLALVVVAALVLSARGADAGACADAAPGSAAEKACRPWSFIYSSKEVSVCVCVCDPPTPSSCCFFFRRACVRAAATAAAAAATKRVHTTTKQPQQPRPTKQTKNPYKWDALKIDLGAVKAAHIEACGRNADGDECDHLTQLRNNIVAARVSACSTGQGELEEHEI